MLSNLISRLFSSRQARQAQEIITAHNTESLEVVKSKVRVLLDNLTPTQLYRECELLNTLLHLCTCACERKQSIMIEGKTQKIWVNYNPTTKTATFNYR